VLQESARLWSEVFANATTGLGIIAAGIWAYSRFVRQRDRFPKAELEHRVTFHRLSDDRLLLRVGLFVRNAGNVLLTWKEGGIRIQQVAPSPSHIVEWIVDGLKGRNTTEGNWPVIAERSLKDHRQEIEPNEADATYFDFVFPMEVETIVVYSFILNAAKSGIAWNHTTTHCVDVDDGEPQMGEKETRQGPPKVAPQTLPKMPRVPQREPTPTPTPQGPPKQPPPSPPPAPKSKG